MTLLLTNDDGIDADGLQALANALAKEHDVWVVAPDRNRSAVSHALTMDRPVRLTQKSEQTYTCSGVPVDCVVAGLRALMPKKPDAVVSGINHGVNLGTDLLFSGTAAAARQSSLYEIPSIAVSLSLGTQSPHFDALADFVRTNLHKLISLCAPDIFVNVNAPGSSPYKGCKLTSLSRRIYHDGIQLYKAPNGHTYGFFDGADVEAFGADDNDTKAVCDGFVSVTRVHAQPSQAGHADFTDMQFSV